MSPKLEDLREDDDPYADELPPCIDLDPASRITIEISPSSVEIFTRRRGYDVGNYRHWYKKERSRMGKQISLQAGEVKRIEVHGFTAEGVDVGIVHCKISGSDNHTIQVSDRGDGTGTVTAVGAGGSSADILADDGQGHTDTAHGTIETEQGPIIDRIEIVEVVEVVDQAPLPEMTNSEAVAATQTLPPPA